MYATVAIDLPLDKTYDYHIPPDLISGIRPGHLVQVPFGTGSQHGIVIDVHERQPEFKTKPVLSLLDPTPVISEQQIAVARWLNQTYLAPIGACLWLWLPPGLTGQNDILVMLGEVEREPADALEAAVVALLARRGPLTGHQLNLALPGKPWRAAVDAMARAGLVRKQPILRPPRARPRRLQVAMLAIPPDQIESRAADIERPSRAADLLERIAAEPNGLPAQTALKAAGATRAHLDALIAERLVKLDEDALVRAAASREVITAALAARRKIEKPLRILRLLAREGEAIDVSWIYAQTGATLADLKRLEEAGLILMGEKTQWRDSLAGQTFDPMPTLALSSEQAAAWRRIEAAVDRAEHKVFLLHGVTGSGKTELYLRAVEHALAQGRSAIFLVPEIALTPQTVRRVAGRFPGKVAVVHSELSIGERYDTWRRAREGRVQVIVGARSALFTPLPNLGLIVLDEEHDASYKQSPPVAPPYYHSRAAAEAIAREYKAVVILGSATPDLETVYRAEQGLIERIELPRRVLGHRARAQQPAEAEQPAAVHIELPPVHVVDMRDELKRGNTSIFSHALQLAIEEVLARGEQAILFLNRRGQSTFVFCRDCGYVVRCPHCDSPLTYHRQGQALRCHRCNHQQREPTACPQCASRRIKFFGAGTQQVEATLAAMFPHARVVRWDADTSSSAEQHDAILQRFMMGRADIMVGTQMIAKGLDLPLVTLVGVVSADVGLGLPDFRAGERTFQLLTQVAGRAGRSARGGKVILQTYQPEHYAIAAAAAHDYATFYARELDYRRQIAYPPVRRLVRILFRFPSETRAQAEAQRAAELLRRRLAALGMTGTDLIGPAPCFFTREKDAFRWHLLLRGPDPLPALRGLDIAKGWFVDVDPVELL
jgi:primosomal protein N' (replication factor Y)